MAVIRTFIQILLESIGEIMVILVALLLGAFFGGIAPKWFISLPWYEKLCLILVLLLVGVALRGFAERAMEEITHGRFFDAIRIKWQW